MKKIMILGASYSQLPLYEEAGKLGISTVAASIPGDWPGFQAADEFTYTDISDPAAASYSQLPLYEEAGKLGISTVAASIPGDWPGFQAADEFTYTDISDPAAVYEVARRFHVDGIATCCLDTGVRALGYACEHLGLKGLSAKAADISSNKFKMKEAFMAGGVNCARHICIRNRQELAEALECLEFPVVLKAVDLMGSRGIFRCNTKEEAFERYEDTMKATGKDYCLAEEFIEGETLGCEAMISNGKLLYCLPNNIDAFQSEDTMKATGKDYCLAEEFIEGETLGCEAMISNGKLLYCLPNNIDAFQSYVPTPIGHSVPYRKQKTLGARVEEQVMLAIQAVGLDNCAVNCDLIEKLTVI